MTDQIPLLLVEDEPHLAHGLTYNLEAEGYLVTHVTTGEEALGLLQHTPYALVILDLTLPGIDGLKVCDQLRESGDPVPILMLTARNSQQDRIAGLSTGADDYLTKPFHLKEFLLRVASLLRRGIWPPAQKKLPTYQFGHNVIDLESRQATTAQGTIQLTELELKMLLLFIKNEGKILTRGELLKQVWGVSPATETRTLDNFVVRLRKYFEADPAKPRYVKTVRGRGYRFVKNPR
ncbi:response regulator transcription factor [Pelovirga terrestris]|uniref:Response regulator transcription factor n=1 Tax=Pelovirga terrestris TaxID=2771352 RepID=A0A8J6QX29_9BACT|nr:response regulator transcription factor [Pelovirga terrestris]MBD1400476.1 response regulator transcription factor [Pelovirga terrestris]